MKMKKVQPKTLHKFTKANKIADETFIALMECKTLTEAAKRLSISRTQLYNRIEEHGLQKRIDEVSKQALDVLKMGAVAAAENMVKKIKHKSAGISLEASRDVLDRVGVKVEPEEQPGEEFTFSWKRKG